MALLFPYVRGEALGTLHFALLHPKCVCVRLFRVKKKKSDSFCSFLTVTLVLSESPLFLFQAQQCCSHARNARNLKQSEKKNFSFFFFFFCKHMFSAVRFILKACLFLHTFLSLVRVAYHLPLFVWILCLVSPFLKFLRCLCFFYHPGVACNKMLGKSSPR